MIQWFLRHPEEKIQLIGSVGSEVESKVNDTAASLAMRSLSFVEQFLRERPEPDKFLTSDPSMSSKGATGVGTMRRAVHSAAGFVYDDCIRRNQRELTAALFAPVAPDAYKRMWCNRRKQCRVKLSLVSSDTTVTVQYLFLINKDNCIYPKVPGVALVFLDLLFQQRYIPKCFKLQFQVSSRAEGTSRKSYVYALSQLHRLGLGLRSKF